MPSADFYTAKSAVHEGDGSVSVVVQLNAASELPLTATYSLGGTAVGMGADFVREGLGPNEIQFSAGDQIQGLNFSILDNASADGDKLIEITLQTVAAGTIVGLVGDVSVHSLHIIDTDSALNVYFFNQASEKNFYDTLPILFDVLFSRPIDIGFHDFVVGDVSFSGSATGIVGSLSNGVGLNLNRRYILSLDTVVGDGTITPALPLSTVRALDDLVLNAVSTGDTAVYDGNSPQNPSGWALSSPNADEVSADFTPVFAGTAINNEEGSVAEVFLEASCSTSIGSSVISGGALNINNIAFASNGADDGLKTFYGLVTDVAAHTSNCVGLGLSYTLDTLGGALSAPANFVAASLDGAIELTWNSCSGCTYDVYWDVSPGVGLTSNSALALPSPSFSHSGLTNGVLHYYRVRVVKSGVGNGPLTSELSAMPANNYCDTGDLQSICTISSIKLIPDNYKLSASGDVIVANGGDLQSNPGQAISLEVGGAITIESGGLVTANFLALSADQFDIQTAGTFVGDTTGLVANTMLVSGSLNGSVTSATLGNLTVNAGGQILADGRGNIAETGTGAGGLDNLGGGGGGHGGAGGRSKGADNGGVSFGNLTNPIFAGSGGGGAGTPIGGAGGGILKFIIQGTLTNNGTITANGSIGVDSGGGGAGGSIWIDVGVADTTGPGIMTGNGLISANGGDGSVLSSNYGGGGGGGRIALHTAIFKYEGDVTVDGGKKGLGAAKPGETGTYYLVVNNQDSICDTGNMGTNSCTLSSKRELGNGFTLSGTTLTVASTGTLSGNIIIDLTGDLTINPGGKITASGHGFGTGAGTGLPGDDNLGGGGGGHGGPGGRSRGDVNGGSTYGDQMNPVTYGSGGGQNTGGYGGGGIKIIVQGTFVNDGEISVNGDDADNITGSGGGAGGSIWVDVGIAKTGGQGLLSGTGSFSANGGAGSLNVGLRGGGGGGGRIALHSVENQYGGSVTVSGGLGTGLGAQSGGPGSFYQQITDLESVCDTGSFASSNCVVNTIRTYADGYVISGPNLTIESTGGLVGNVTINLTGNLILNDGYINGSVTLDLGGDLTISSGAQITANGKGALPDTGVGYFQGGGGAGHGGVGGFSRGANNGGPIHGSTDEPISVGGGGGGNSGGPGGGAIKISMAGTLTNEGSISANGLDAADVADGGGAGGSIWVNVGISKTGGAGLITGSGSISATGGAGLDNGSYFGGGGGGGRIALHSVNYNYQGSVDLVGGAVTSYFSNPGERGTFYQVVSNIDSLCDSGSMGTNNCQISTTRHLGDGFTLTGSDLTITATGSFIGNIIVNLSGDLALNDGSILGNVQLDVLGDLTVSALAKISSDGMGFENGLGVGASTNYSAGGGGAGHGGIGGTARGGGNGGTIYGSLANPSSAGSSGGGYEGGSGGGLIKILVRGVLTNNGTISANGSDAAVGRGSGGGAGGSLWIDVGITNTGGSGNLTGTGNFSAKGGAGSNNGSFFGGGGGGGRLAIYSSDYNYRGVVNLAGGNFGGYSSTPGRKGSFYQELTNLDSLCDGATSFSTICQISDVITVGDGLTIAGGAVNNLTIESGGSLSAIAPTSNAQLVLLGNLIINAGGTIDLNLKRLEAVNIDVYGSFIGNILSSQITNLYVHNTGSISANGRGFSGSYKFITGAGFGGGTYNGDRGGGGGYGGTGGIGSNAGSNGGSSYGANTLPIYKGSAGASGQRTVESYGGSGGGIIYLLVSNTLTVDGVINSNGENGTQAAGGGSGGSIWIDTATLTGIASGKIDALGGDGSAYSTTYGGGGGGGRIALYRASDTFSGSPFVTGGTSGGGTAVNGSLGTIATSSSLSPHITLVTSTTFDGNLGGLIGADLNCNSLMNSQGLGGTWKALLSSSAEDISARISITGSVTNLRWDANSGPQTLATNSVDYWDGTLAAATGYDETGATRTDLAWTGTDGTPTAGINSGDNCADWIDTGSSGTSGSTDQLDDTWLDAASSSCLVPQRLYCVSQ